MRRPLVAAVAAVLLATPLAAVASSAPPLRDVAGARAAVVDDGVRVSWAATGPVRVLRDGMEVAALPAGTTSWLDRSVAPAAKPQYRVVAPGGLGAPVPARVELPPYRVGAATADITPSGTVNLGGFGLGDGSIIPEELIGRGSTGRATKERIRARAAVVDDGRTAVAVASIETQGMFAAYQDGPYGLLDIAQSIAKRVPIAPERIMLTTDHTHSGPDTIGAWGGTPLTYLKLVHDRTVTAVVQAYRTRTYASLRAGHSDASDLIYNQSCSEALNQDEEPAYTGPEVCATPGKDGMVRVVQATTPSGKRPLTLMAFAAHATAGGGEGLHGDWPQFLSEELSRRYGGTGLAMVGALGGTQPCRPACSFTKRSNPGFGVKDRKTAIVLNYAAHVAAALRSARPVFGSVAGAQSFIREPITGPAVTALFAAGHYAGADLMRSHRNPWAVGPTVRTVVGLIRIGDVFLLGTPGEGFPRIGQDLRDALGDSASEVVQLGLANDQLGYLIAPASYVPVIAAEVAVNDNIIFNVSPTIGDHVACAGIGLVDDVGLTVDPPPHCLGYLAYDAAGDPVAAVPVGGIVLP